MINKPSLRFELHKYLITKPSKIEGITDTSANLKLLNAGTLDYEGVKDDIRKARNGILNHDGGTKPNQLYSDIDTDITGVPIADMIKDVSMLLTNLKKLKDSGIKEVEAYVGDNDSLVFLYRENMTTEEIETRAVAINEKAVIKEVEAYVKQLSKYNKIMADIKKFNNG